MVDEDVYDGVNESVTLVLKDVEIVGVCESERVNDHVYERVSVGSRDSVSVGLIDPVNE